MTLWRSNGPLARRRDDGDIGRATQRAFETQPAGASEDFSVFGRRWGVPYVFWIVGGTDPEVYAQAKSAKRLNELPSNHSPRYAPVLHPTLKTGLQAMLAGAGAWLAAGAEPAA